MLSPGKPSDIREADHEDNVGSSAYDGSQYDETQAPDGTHIAGNSSKRVSGGGDVTGGGAAGHKGGGGVTSQLSKGKTSKDKDAADSRQNTKK